MIGDRPKGAPLRCRLGKHLGQQDGGTIAYTCPRCGGTYWQTQDFDKLTAWADREIDAGRGQAALTSVRAEVARATRR